MFPTSGYFNSIPCPYYVSGLCDRPYCHFKHSKHEQNLSHAHSSKSKKNSPFKQSFSSLQDAPVYHPTPIALLEKREESIRNAKSLKNQHQLASTSQNFPTYSPVVVTAAKSKCSSSSSNSSLNETSPIKSASIQKDPNNSEVNLNSNGDDCELEMSDYKSIKERHDSNSSPVKIDSPKQSTAESPTAIQKMGKVKRKRAKEMSQPSTPIKSNVTKEEPGSKLAKLYSDLFGEDAEDDPPKKYKKLNGSEPSSSTKISSSENHSISSLEVRESSQVETTVNSSSSECKPISDTSLIPRTRKLTPKEIMYNRMVDHRKELLEKVASASKGQQSNKAPARPTVPRTCGNKISLVTRQRYLNQFVDECLKLFPNNPNAAYDRALDEEETTYQKSSGHSIYINSAIRVVRKLREEQRVDKGNVATRVATNLVSHAAVLNRSLSSNCGISSNKTISDSEIESILKGSEFHKMLEKYLLTEEQLVANGYPRPAKESYNSGVAVIHSAAEKLKNLKDLKRFCSRCGTEFAVSPTGEILNFTECVYHWGKAWRQRVKGQGVDHRYSCCAGDLSQKGCQVAPSHVHDLNKWTDNRDYIRTLPPESAQSPKCYALDCEMVYTSNGCELARITVIDQYLKSVYEKVVRPLYPVIDYNTRFSGLTESSIPPDASILIDVQSDLIKLFNEQTILIGHSLESDLTALKIIHSNVVDTSTVFPHRLGPPKKRALRNIVADVLQKIIQSDVNGHDSREDAVVCMELMQNVVKDDLKKRSRKRTI